ncbi:MAG TPA: O-antigen ligase family protein [Pyrinomonadaceae bacterium]|nr:O-antigen ligase family protein [Pyrinomonadaceae bacterium]
MFLFAVAAPHSIAAAQGAWVGGVLLCAARFLVRPRPVWRRTPLDYWLLGFFIWTFLSALVSYEPDISVGKLRAASLFTIVYLVAQNVASRRAARALLFALVASCMVNVFYTFGVYAKGRGVKVRQLHAESPLRAAGVREGDTLLAVDEVPVNHPSEVEKEIQTVRALTIRWPNGETACVSSEREACVSAYRAEAVLPLATARARLLEGVTPEARLGIAGWSAGRDERASGFYGQYMTYAEVLQLIGSLALGLLAARRFRRDRVSALLAAGLACVAVALLLTVTRGAWLGFLVSAFVVLLAASAGRRALVMTTVVAVPLVLAGLFVLQQKRRVGFLDARDGSTSWRLIVYREGFEVLTRSPRHLLAGVGMDSIKRRWREWGMFDGGRIPVGHLHSTPLQLAFERGLPALLLWLALMYVYGRTLWRLARTDKSLEWAERGLAIGALGGLAGFLTSGLVHYNFGDSEVVMVFYFVMGLALAVERRAREEGEGREAEARSPETEAVETLKEVQPA